jgi:hypothetical protein
MGNDMMGNGMMNCSGIFGGGWITIILIWILLIMTIIALWTYINKKK